MDSIEYADPETINGLNLYAYCGNNPVMNEKWGAGNWHRGAGTEFNALRKWFDRIIRVMFQ